MAKTPVSSTAATAGEKAKSEVRKPNKNAVWIPLQRAFLIVLHDVERQQEIPATQRLGRATPRFFVGDIGREIEAHGKDGIPQGMIPPRWVGVEAKGPAYVSGRAVAPQPTRKGSRADVPGQSLPGRVYIPSVPDAIDLHLLLEDDHDASERTSAEEKRICTTHRWLFGELTSGRLAACAEAEYTPEDDSAPWTCSGDTVRPEDWNGATVDYRGSWIDLGEEIFSVEYCLAQYDCRIVFSNIQLDFANLRDALATRPPSASPVEFPLGYTATTGEWTVRWKGKIIDSFKTELVSETVGLMAHFITNMYGGSGIHVKLIANFKRNPCNTRPYNNDDFMHKNIVNSEISEIASKLAAGRCHLDECHIQLNEKLKLKNLDDEIKSHEYSDDNSKVRIGETSAVKLLRKRLTGRLCHEEIEGLLSAIQAGFSRKGGFCRRDVGHPLLLQD